MNDYYAILGIEKNASADEIKTAYRFLAAQLHPDKHQGQNAAIADKKLKELNEAYQVLSDVSKRAAYDKSSFDSVSKSSSSDIHGQTWAGRTEIGLNYKATSLTFEQFDRHVRAQEVTYDYAWLNFNDKIDFGTVIKGRMPKFSGYYYVSKQYLPKISNMSPFYIYGNTAIGEFSLAFATQDISILVGSGATAGTLFEGRVISLRHNWNEYANAYNQFVKLINGD